MKHLPLPSFSRVIELARRLKLKPNQTLRFFNPVHMRKQVRLRLSDGRERRSA